MTRTRFIAFVSAAALALAGPAWAGSGTVNYNSSGGAPFATTTDGSGNNYGRQTLWDYSAGANGLAISANHGLFANVEEWAGGVLGAPSNYGTSPGAVLVPSVNAFVTNTHGITAASGAVADLYSASPPAPYAGSGAATTIAELDAIRQTAAQSIPAGNNVIGQVAPKTGAFTIPGCTVGVASAQCLAAATAVNHVQIQNASATATIACAWGATAALNGATSVYLLPGQAANWGPETSGIPSSAMNCIASGASTPLYLEYN